MEQTQHDTSKIRAAHLRPMLRQIRLAWIDGAGSEQVQARGGKRLSTGKEVLMALFDRMTYGQWEIEDPIADIARSIDRSRRTITRHMWVLEELGLIQRVPTGPSPWLTRLRVQVVQELAKDHASRAAAAERQRKAERAERWRAQRSAAEERYCERRGLVAAPAEPFEHPPGPPAPPPQDRPALVKPPPLPTTRPERRRGERTSPALAASLWNLVPYLPPGAPEAHEQTRWSREVLASSPQDVWLDMIAYVDLTARGSGHYWPAAVSVVSFQRWLHDVRQWRLADGAMAEPWLGRSRRVHPVTELPAPPPWEEVRDRRAGVLAPWLRSLAWELCRCHEDLVRCVGDVLQQAQGPPWPDWLPEVLRPEWGDLPLLDHS